MNDDLRAGRLEQACAVCGTWEAAGSYCTACYRPMGPADWYHNGNVDRRAVAHQNRPQKSQTPLKRGRGRPHAELSASAGTLGL